MLVDSRILNQCKKNDRRAQYELYRLVYPVLMSVCLRYERNKEDAEEILNLGFYKILTKLEHYSDTVPFEAWIRKIMANTIIDEYRKNKKHEVLENVDFSEDPNSGGYELNSADLELESEELLQLLKILPNVTGKVFNLYAIEGFSHKEIAEQLNISVGTSKWHLSTARKTLQEKIKELNQTEIKNRV